MINLDDYLSTQDELFNTNAQRWYFEFSGNKKPNTEKPFDVFVKALHEVYFFIQDNLNKPFGCIEKINNVSETNGFNEIEKLILVDKILGVLFNQPKDIGTITYLQIVDYRNELSPYLNDPEIINHKWHFDIDKLKQELEALETPKERETFLLNTLLDYKAKAPELDELEIMYYNEIGLINWIETELQRLKLTLVLQNKSDVKDKPVKYRTKHYVLAYLFQCSALGESLPRGVKKELEQIGNKFMGKGKGNTFYKEFNKLCDKEFHNETTLIKFWGENWRKAVLELSKKPESIETYLKTKQL